MKITVIFSLLFFLCGDINAQRVYHIQFYDGKFFHELSKDNLVLDVVNGGDHKILFLSIKTLEGHLEFYRQDDTTYYSREKINNETVKQGAFNLVFPDNIKIDTIEIWDPGIFEPKTLMVSNHQLVKVGKWNEKDKKGNRWQGAYLNNQRDGFWKNLTTSKHLNFKAGNLIGYHAPTKQNIENNLNWILDKNFYWLKKSRINIKDEVDLDAIHQLLKKDSEIKIDAFAESPPENKWNQLQIFKLKKNGTVIFKEDWNVKQEKYNSILKGKWKIEDAQLIFSFDKIEPLKVFVHYLSKDKIRLEKSNL